MSKNEFDTIITGARELSEEELTLIQGGGLGSWLKKAVKSVGHALEDTAHAVVDFFSGKSLQQQLEDLKKRLPIIYN